jgi:hypothetical protein
VLAACDLEHRAEGVATSRRESHQE